MWLGYRAYTARALEILNLFLSTTLHTSINDEREFTFDHFMVQSSVKTETTRHGERLSPGAGGTRKSNLSEDLYN